MNMIYVGAFCKRPYKIKRFANAHINKTFWTPSYKIKHFRTSSYRYTLPKVRSAQAGNLGKVDYSDYQSVGNFFV